MIVFRTLPEVPLGDSGLLLEEWRVRVGLSLFGVWCSFHWGFEESKKLISDECAGGRQNVSWRNRVGRDIVAALSWGILLFIGANPNQASEESQLGEIYHPPTRRKRSPASERERVRLGCVDVVEWVVVV